MVGDVEVTGSVERQALGIGESGGGGGAAVPGEVALAVPDRAAPRDRGDDARHGVHPANALVVLIGDEQVAGSIHGQELRRIEAGRGRRAAIAAEAAAALEGSKEPDGVDLRAPCDSGDDPGRRVHLADAVHHVVNQIEIARPIHRQP